MHKTENTKNRKENVKKLLSVGLCNEFNQLQFIGSVLFATTLCTYVPQYKTFQHETTLNWKKYCLNSTLKHTIQKWLSSRHSATPSHETFTNGTVTHKTHTFTNAKSWVSCSGFTWPNKTTKSSQNTFSAEKCHTDQRVCGCLKLCHA